MSTPPEDILNQRRLRAAEIALETARRRRFETDETVRALETAISDAEAALEASRAGRARDRAKAQADLEVARRGRLLAEQRLVDERGRRHELEQELGGLRRQKSRADGLARQSASAQRIRQLEAELELVARRAAEFEYGVRMAAFDAFKLVRELVDRVGSVLPSLRLPLPELGRGNPESPSEADGDAQASGSVAPAGASATPASKGLDSERLDAALERLRASTPPPADDE
jgi:multidrug efflux pump subunit AcrA (membrane-fusion protein)